MRDVESALYAMPDVMEACAYTVGIPFFDETIHAVLAVRQGSQTTIAALHDKLSRWLPAHHRPDRYVIVESFPKTATGMIFSRLVRERVYSWIDVRQQTQV